jgi:hypothetical protein
MDVLIILCHYEEGAEGDSRLWLKLRLYASIDEVIS